ncbi:MAG: AI-2E family transporter [Bacteroidetes bacterium]|nr:AI-2E family transporter [Bacteroidota bacterium]
MINRKEMSQFVLLMFLTGLFLYICWLMLAPFISVILWSAILTIIFYPLYKKLFTKTNNHSLSAIITIIVSLFTFIIPFLAVLASAVNEIAGISSASVDDIKQILTDLQNGKISFIYTYLNDIINIDDILKPEDIKSFIDTIKDAVLSASLYFIEGAFGIFIGITLSVFCMFYLFRDGENIISKIPEIMPMEKSQSNELIRETSALINATIRGTLFIALLQGTLAGLIFWIMGIPSYILLGILAMIFSMIPTGGTAFVTVPVIIVLLISGEYGKAVMIAVYAALVIGMIDNFLLPKLIKQRVKMNELFVFFSVIGGIQLFGLVGLFMGPIILAITLGIFSVFRGKKIDKNVVSM